MTDGTTWGILAAVVAIAVGVGAYTEWRGNACERLDDYCARAGAALNMTVTMQCALVIQGDKRSSPRACAASLRALRKVNPE